MAKKIKEQDEYFAGRKVKPAGRTAKPIDEYFGGRKVKPIGRIAKPEPKRGLRSGSQSKNGKGYKQGE